MKVNKSLVALFALVVAAVFFFPLSNVNGKTNTVVLSKSNTIVLSGEVDGETASSVILQARALSDQHSWADKPLYLFMNTPGGSIQTGLEIIEALKGLGRPITTVSLFSASMGFQIVQGLGERLVLSNGVLMSHRASGQIAGYFGGKRPSQLDSRYNLWLNRITELDKQTVKRTNGKQTLDSYQSAYADELWLTGAQSIEGGYADKIVTVKCDSSLDGVTTHSINFLGMKINYDLDNCPVNTSPMNVRIGSSPDEDAENELTYAQKEEIKTKFMEQYISKLRTVIRMYW